MPWAQNHKAKHAAYMREWRVRQAEQKRQAIAAAIKREREEIIANIKSRLTDRELT